jgi:ubiquinone/menaquinone biosynthesis C-methylase UbiE
MHGQNECKNQEFIDRTGLSWSVASNMSGKHKEYSMKKTNMNKIEFFAALCILMFSLISHCFAQDLDSRDQERNNKSKDSLAMEIAGLKKGMFVGEVGAGDGYFTFMLSNHIGSEGRVYANDIIEKGALEVIRVRAREKEIENIRTILGTDEDPKLPKGQLDMIFIVNAFHDFTKPVKMLCNIAPALKPGGKLVIIDSEGEKSRRLSKLRIYNRQDLQEWVNQSPFVIELIDDKSLPYAKVIYLLTMKQKSE